MVKGEAETTKEFRRILEDASGKASGIIKTTFYNYSRSIEDEAPRKVGALEKLTDAVLTGVFKYNEKDMEIWHATAYALDSNVDKLVERAGRVDPDSADLIPKLNAVHTCMAIINTQIPTKSPEDVSEYITVFKEIYDNDPDTTDIDAWTVFFRKIEMVKKRVVDKMEMIPPAVRQSFPLGTREMIVPFLEKYKDEL